MKLFENLSTVFIRAFILMYVWNYALVPAVSFLDKISYVVAIAISITPMLFTKNINIRGM